MPTSHQEKIQQLVAKATNPEMSPITRLDAAREYLKISDFSDRALRIGKRLGKFYSKNKDVSEAIRCRGLNLLTFALERKQSSNDTTATETAETSEIAVSAQSELSATPKVWTLADENVGWDVLPVPRKFISYYEPADLPAFGIPAEPDLATLQRREGQTLQITTGAGGIYYVDFGDVYIGGKNKNYILNPRYVTAFEAWKAEHPGGELFFGDKPAPSDIFNYEFYLSRYRANGPCPVMMMWHPTAPAYVRAN